LKDPEIILLSVYEEYLMVQPRFDVLGIGNAMVDVIAHTTDAFLDDNKLLKGAMSLVDAETAQQLYGKSGPGIECSGGSAGNTISCLASLGSRAAFVGKVFDDQLGRVFAHDIRAQGVHFETPLAVDGPPTAMILSKTRLPAPPLPIWRVICGTRKRRKQRS
jgi:sugar/nucleoside kinase (ribokinase family)